jgi:hypothetical protein
MKLSRIRMPSPAMVVAVVALIAALGGGAYAAVQVGKNSVSAKSLKKNAVITKKIKNLAVTEAKLADGSVSAAKLKPGAGAGIGVLTTGQKIINTAATDTIDLGTVKGVNVRGFCQDTGPDRFAAIQINGVTGDRFSGADSVDGAAFTPDNIGLSAGYAQIGATASSAGLSRNQVGGWILTPSGFVDFQAFAAINYAGNDCSFGATFIG